MGTYESKRAIGWLMLVGVLGCAGSVPPPAAPEPSPGKPAPAEASAAMTPVADEPAPEDQLDVPPAGSTFNRVMQAHFNDALLIRRAVIAGAPEQAANPAYVLTQLQDSDNVPEGWKPFVSRMQQIAGRIHDGTTASLVAGATADLGIACGQCHRQNGGPTASVEPAPAPGSTVEGRMKRHVWATERLWEGLYVPSDGAWLAGANALVGEPFPDEVLKEGGVHARSAAGDFAQLASRAPHKKTLDDRASLYAELLVTCGSCHRAMKNK